MPDRIAASPSVADFAGDAVFTLTAPFYEDCDPLAELDPRTLPSPSEHVLAGAFIPRDLQIGGLAAGTLTYQSEQPAGDQSFTFGGTSEFCDRLIGVANAVIVPRSEIRFDYADIKGLLDKDGVGAIAITLRVAGGWDSRTQLLNAIGRHGREELAARIRLLLLDPLAQLLTRCRPEAQQACIIPYFNATYCGLTTHSQPGTAELDPELRQLIYPTSAGPLYSSSPWRDQFFYAGYAFNLLMTPDPASDMDKLGTLLMLLDVMYARLARTADAADELQRSQDGTYDIDWLTQLSSRLRADYSALITPTFSFDHHILRIRDAILAGWETDKLQRRTTDLLEIVQHRIEARLNQQQVRRVNRLNLIVIVLTVLSIASTVESCFELLGRM